MPQTVQDLCLSDWKLGYTVDVTFYCRDRWAAVGSLKSLKSTDKAELISVLRYLLETLLG